MAETDWRFSLVFAQGQPLMEAVKLWQASEDAGLDMLGVADSPNLLRELYVSTTVCALNTKKADIITYVTNPVTHHPSVTASAFMSLNELAPGRIGMGIGTGDSALWSIGQKGARVATMRDYILTVKALLRGEKVTWHDTPFEAAWSRVEPFDLPVYVACAGPKILHMAAEVADGAIVTMGFALVRHLHDSFGVRVKIVPFNESRATVRRYDDSDRTVLLSEVLPQSSRNFQLANQIGLLQFRATIDSYFENVRFANPDTPAFARIALANYFAGAVLMPYESFFEASKTVRHDIDILESRFGVSFEQACHRLTTLQRPGARGAPLHFVRVDIAGNISKRFSSSGIQISRQGGACPRWNVYDAFMSPGLIRTQVSKTPDGATYFCIARTVQKQGGGYWQRQSYLAIGLGCRIEDAKTFVPHFSPGSGGIPILFLQSVY